MLERSCNFNNCRMSTVERISIESLKRAANRRPEGYLDDVMSKGQMSGEFLEIESSELTALRCKYAVKQGLGDRVASFLKPVARAVDRMLGTNLENCGSCEQRRQWLNGINKGKTNANRSIH